MRKYFLGKLIFFLVLALIAKQDLYAQFEEGKAFGISTPIIGTGIVNSATNTVSYSSAGESFKKLTNVITLKINEQSNIYFASAFRATVQLKIESWAILPANAGQAATTTETQTLVVNYDPATGAKYDVRAYYVLPASAERVKITVNNISITGQSGWNPLQVLQLENEMKVLRYYTLSNKAADLTPIFPATPPATNTDANGNTDAVNVTWQTPAAANNNITQLEWAWVEDEMLNYYPIIPYQNVLDMNNIFYNNSTRVDLTQNNYSIPLLYDGVGHLYYRVRVADRKDNGTVISGPWSAIQSFAYQGHAPNLNWQSTTSFAEDAKLKSVIQYFDGTLRNRQTVTKDYSTGNTIVGETIYDMQGRPNVQILPTPTIETVIHYFKNFNRFVGQASITSTSGEQYLDDPAKYFDLTPADIKCNRSPALDNTYGSGSAKYYSANNDWLTTEAKSKNIPDAQGYPYSETRYTDDPTQRVASQGGVGPDHQISSGHETKYYYGKPTQQEMDALFGTEVGDASHYSKNMVRDANGQMSVSYVDMHGRTVATSLAGAPPTSLKDISNATDYPTVSGTLTNQLLTQQTNIVKGNSIESISTILVPNANEINTFYYSLTPAILSQVNCKNEQVCFDCKYDLQISMTPEDCGGTPIVLNYNNLKIVPADQACGTPMGFTGDGITTPTTQISFSQSLSQGAWVIRKTLTLDDQSLQDRKAIALQDFLCTTETDLYNSIFSTLSTTSGCGIPQTVTDLANLGTLARIHMQMLLDVAPYTGQYAQDPATLSNTDPVLKYNIFTPHQAGSSAKMPFYKYPVTETGAASNYYTEENIIDPTIEPTGKTDATSMLGTISGVNFGAIFKPSWAKSLVYYHPEFNKWNYANTNLSDAFAYLDRLQSITQYASATDLFSGTANDYSIINADPFFRKINDFNKFRTVMQVFLTQSVKLLGSGGVYDPSRPLSPPIARADTRYPSIWKIANSTVKCATYSDADKSACEASEAYATGLDPTLDKGKVIQALISTYLSYRNEMVIAYINSNAPNALSPNNMQALENDKKQLYFAPMADMVNQEGFGSFITPALINNANTAGVDAAANAYIAANNLNPDACVAQKPFWKAKLLQCEQFVTLLNSTNTGDVTKANTIINAVLDGMVSVCHNSVTADQTNGASTVNPSYTGTPQSFEEVINQVFAQYGIATIPGNNYFCNPFTIDYPKPFGYNTPVAINYSSSIDPCGCTAFSNLKKEATSMGFDPTNFASMNQFLEANYQDVLTQPLWDGLQRCTSGTNGYSAVNLADAVVVPSFLNCDYRKPCITCGQLDLLTTEFRQIFPAYSGVPYMDATTTDDQQSQNGLWTRFINYRTGVTKNTTDYITAYTTCGLSGPPCPPNSGVDDLTVSVRLAPFQTEYTARKTVTVLPNFVSRTPDEFVIDITPGLDICPRMELSGNNAVCSFSKALNDVSALFPVETDPCKQVEAQASFAAQLEFSEMKDALIANFEKLYLAKCLTAQSNETFYAKYTPSEYHYTLYYYDQAGNLEKTLPPAAVKPNYDATYLSNVATARANNNDLANANNNDQLATRYVYNTLNQVTVQKTPDAGTSKFWYDRLGRLTVSQNAKQITNASYSYTMYDPLGRITEVGQKLNGAAMQQATSQNDQALSAWLSSGGVKEQITRTIYDEPYTPIATVDLTTGDHGLYQQNLRNRVSYTYIEKSDNIQVWDAATFYSYDPHGNVDTLLQDYQAGMGKISCNSKPGTNEYKRIAYNYDLISSKVNQVAYQQGRADQFYHRYQYDDENRIIGIQTSKDSIYWETDASYDYYRHGLLARTVLGQNLVQGIDYAYTLQGWLKGVNSNYLNNSVDMGADGLVNGIHSQVSRDAYAFTLGYFDGDYVSIGGNNARSFAQKVSAANTISGGANTANLYNGNISYSFNALLPFDYNTSTGASTFMGYNYTYDQLNRLSGVTASKAAATTLGVTSVSWPMATNNTLENVTYDPNGNIRTYLRNRVTPAGGAFTAMDNLTYSYKPNTNQLAGVTDAVTAHTDDIASDNYTYDAIGQLATDQAQNITSITWTVYGKIQTINKSDGTVINYTYDASGNRISKAVKAGGQNAVITTYYVRDATGNVMSTYLVNSTINGNDLTQNEIDLYGSSRLAVYNVNIDVENCIGNLPLPITTFTRGNKFFELNNHLSNVLATISDKKIGHLFTGNTIDYYISDVITANDYYPFGMVESGRIYNQSNITYEYSFNGKEKLDETNNNDIDFGARINDVRLGRWFSIDPTPKYFESPYVSMGNNPIAFIDPDGKDNIIYLYAADNSVSTRQLLEIAKQATANFKLLGLKTEVRVFDSKNGKFDQNAYSKLQPTDAVAVIGEAANVEKSVATFNPANSKRLISGFFGRNGADLSHDAEDSQNPGQSTSQNDGNIIAIATGATKTVSTSYKATFIQTAAFFINHGAGHNSGLNHAGEDNVFDRGKPKSIDDRITPFGINVMNDGDQISDAVYRGVKFSQFITSPINLQGESRTEYNQLNRSILQAFKARFGNNNPTTTLPTLPPLK